MTRFFTYYYGGMHSCYNRNREAGYRINEWDLVKKSHSRIKPLLGYWDDSKPETLLNEIKIAEKYGVDGFIMNLYHNGEWPELYKPINTFCKVSKDSKIMFALNWCYRMPKRILPTPLEYNEKKVGHLIHDVTEEEKNITIKLSYKKIKKIAQFVSENYLCKKNYIKVNNKYYFSFYHITGLLRNYGFDGLNKILGEFRQAMRSYGFELHIVGLLSITSEDEEYDYLIEKLDIDAVSAYCCLPDFKSKIHIQEYAKLSRKRVHEWALCKSKYYKHFYPAIAAGWDASARGEKGYHPKKHSLRFPWAPIVVNNSPQNFYVYLKEAMNFCKKNLSGENKIVILGPWNEWSEGCYLLPDKKEGFGKLKVINKVKLEEVRS